MIRPLMGSTFLGLGYNHYLHCHCLIGWLASFFFFRFFISLDGDHVSFDFLNFTKSCHDSLVWYINSQLMLCANYLIAMKHWYCSCFWICWASLLLAWVIAHWGRFNAVRSGTKVSRNWWKGYGMWKWSKAWKLMKKNSTRKGSFEMALVREWNCCRVD